jgi:hypothetical protein
LSSNAVHSFFVQKNWREKTGLLGKRRFDDDLTHALNASWFVSTRGSRGELSSRGTGVRNLHTGAMDIVGQKNRKAASGQRQPIARTLKETHVALLVVLHVHRHGLQRRNPNSLATRGDILDIDISSMSLPATYIGWPSVIFLDQREQIVTIEVMPTNRQLRRGGIREKLQRPLPTLRQTAITTALVQPIYDHSLALLR